MPQSSDERRTLIHAGPGPAPYPTDDQPTAPENKPTDVELKREPTGGSGVFARLAPGERVPGTRYRIIRFIGDGGMGAVYEAEHTDLERKVALKVLLPELCRSPEAVQMFRDEARSASRAGCEQIVELYDFAELPDRRLMFTMELLSGPTLAKSLAGGPMPPARVIGILRQMCKGLAAAHKAGVVHRDIKPENIVLARKHGKPDTVKILDFGISTIVTEGKSDAPLSAGTPYYLAPELITQTGFDARADIYALGCTAFEMLSGRPPFMASSGNVDEVLQKHLSEAPPKMEALGVSDVPPALERVVRRALAKLPTNRQRNMAVLEAAICEAQIEAELTTAWDDLPLPDGIEQERRDKLLTLIPDPDRRVRSGGWVWPLIAAVSLLVGAGAMYKFGMQGSANGAAADPDVQVARSAVQIIMDEAQAAAALNIFVYPPSDDTEAPTAYTKVRELESLTGDEATEAKGQAVALREEFSLALVQLGDAYWDNEGARDYAIDYYRQALCFDRSNAQAVERSGFSPEEIEEFAQRAETKDFTDEEIEAAEPLVVLAEPDRKKRRKKLKEMRARRRARGKTDKARHEKLLALSDTKSGKPDSGAPKDTKPNTDPASLDIPTGMGANELAASGRRSLSEGKSAEAEMFFKRALTYDPKNVAALSALYGLRFNKGNYSEAVGFARRLIGAAPSNAKFYIQYGDALFKLARYPGAKAAYDKAAELGSKLAKSRLKKVAAKLPPESAVEAPKDDASAEGKEQASADTPSDEKPTPG